MVHEHKLNNAADSIDHPQEARNDQCSWSGKKRNNQKQQSDRECERSVETQPDFEPDFPALSGVL
jgi:hypothetical protein